MMDVALSRSQALDAIASRSFNILKTVSDSFDGASRLRNRHDAALLNTDRDLAAPRAMSAEQRSQLHECDNRPGDWAIATLCPEYELGKLAVVKDLITAMGRIFFADSNRKAEMPALSSGGFKTESLRIRDELRVIGYKEDRDGTFLDWLNGAIVNQDLQGDVNGAPEHVNYFTGGAIDILSELKGLTQLEVKPREAFVFQQLPGLCYEGEIPQWVTAMEQSLGEYYDKGFKPGMELAIADIKQQAEERYQQFLDLLVRVFDRADNLREKFITILQRKILDSRGMKPELAVIEQDLNANLNQEFSLVSKE